MNKGFKLVFLTAIAISSGSYTLDRHSNIGFLNACASPDESSTETLNKQAPDAKRAKAKKVVVFRDGSSITEDEIKSDIDQLPPQIASRMSLTDIKSFLAWKRAYGKVMTDAAIKSGIMKSKEVMDLIEKRKKTTAGFMLMDEKAKELMTPQKLEEHYSKFWDKNFKGTKEFSLIAVTTSDKTVADNIRNNVKSEEDLKKILDANQSSTKQMLMDGRSQKMFPQEINDAILKGGVNSVVGPFEVKGASMLFFVKDIADSKKKEFTEEFAEEYQKVALRDFMRDYTKILYEKYNVKILDVDKKPIDPFTLLEGNPREEPNKKNIAKLEKFKDSDIIATYDGGKVTVSDLKDFFKIDSLLDQTFLSMAQQFNISPEKVVVYAVKLLMDDCVLAKEVNELKYDQRKEVVEKLNEVGNIEIQHAYFKENVKIKSEDTRKAFDRFMKSIPEEDKNDNEFSVKMLFYPTEEEATKSLESISSGETKFSDIYKDKISKKETIDLGYIKKRGTTPDLWNLLKRGASGTCCKQVVELDSKQFGIDGKNYVLVYIADRRPVTLPSLSNESEKKYFQRLAERDKAVELAKNHLISGVKSIEGNSIEELYKVNPEYVERMISVLMGYAG